MENKIQQKRVQINIEILQKASHNTGNELTQNYKTCYYNKDFTIINI